MERPRRAYTSVLLIVRLALFGEGGHTFALIRRAEEAVEQATRNSPAGDERYFGLLVNGLFAGKNGHATLAAWGP